MCLYIATEWSHFLVCTLKKWKWRLYARMPIAIIFVLAPNWVLPKYPLKVEWIDFSIFKQWLVHTNKNEQTKSPVDNMNEPCRQDVEQMKPDKRLLCHCFPSLWQNAWVKQLKGENVYFRSWCQKFPSQSAGPLLLGLWKGRNMVEMHGRGKLVTSSNQKRESGGKGIQGQDIPFKCGLLPPTWPILRIAHLAMNSSVD
jgi:hypothetical protein